MAARSRSKSTSDAKRRRSEGNGLSFGDFLEDTITDAKRKKSSTNNFDEKLMRYASIGDTRLLKEFLSNGIHVDTQDKQGRTALMMACSHGRIDTMITLVEDFEADIDVQDEKGRTPLMYAAYQGHVDPMRFLVEKYNADVERRNKRGDTALMLAVKNGHLRAVKYLVGTARANPMAGNDDDKIPVVVAREDDQSAILKFLLTNISKDLAIDMIPCSRSKAELETLFKTAGFDLNSVISDQLKKSVSWRRAKLSVLGGPQTGKTSLILSLSNRSFRKRILPTKIGDISSSTLGHPKAPGAADLEQSLGKCLQRWSKETKESFKLETDSKTFTVTTREDVIYKNKIDTTNVCMSLEDESIRLRIFEFGGDEKSLSTAHLFTQASGCYIICFSLEKFAAGDRRSRQELMHWLELVRLRAPKAPLAIVATHLDKFKKNLSGFWSRNFNKKGKQDKRDQKILEVNRELLSMVRRANIDIEGKYRNFLICKLSDQVMDKFDFSRDLIFFPIDNTRSRQQGKRDPQLMLLKSTLQGFISENLITGLKSPRQGETKVDQDVPIAWTAVYDRLTAIALPPPDRRQTSARSQNSPHPTLSVGSSRRTSMNGSRHSYVFEAFETQLSTVPEQPVLTIEDVQEIASEFDIEGEQFVAMLHKFHELGLVVFFDQGNVTSEQVILAPHLLIYAISILNESASKPRGTIESEQQQEAWDRFLKNGRLDYCLLKPLWAPIAKTVGVRSFLLKHLEYCRIIGRSSAPDAKEWFVPTRLPESFEGKGMSVGGDVKRFSLAVPRGSRGRVWFDVMLCSIIEELACNRYLRADNERFPLELSRLRAHIRMVESVTSINRRRRAVEFEMYLLEQEGRIIIDVRKWVHGRVLSAFIKTIDSVLRWPMVGEDRAEIYIHDHPASNRQVKLNDIKELVKTGASSIPDLDGKGMRLSKFKDWVDLMEEEEAHVANLVKTEQPSFFDFEMKAHTRPMSREIGVISKQNPIESHFDKRPADYDLYKLSPRGHSTASKSIVLSQKTPKATTPDASQLCSGDPSDGNTALLEKKNIKSESSSTVKFDDMDENEVAEWLKSIGKKKHGLREKTIQAIIEQELDGAGLLELSSEDIKEFVQTVGARKRLERALDELRREDGRVSWSLSQSAAPMLFGKVAFFRPEDVKKLHILGRGSFGEAHLCEVRGLKNKVVLKSPIKRGGFSNETLRELRIMSEVTPHANIVEFVGLVTLDHVVCFMTTYCEKGSLDGLHKTENMSERKRFLGIAANVADGLRHLHSQNIIHRDLACRNLLMKSNGSVVICDYGLSHKLEDNSNYYEMRTSKFPWAWTSPETLVSKKFTRKSDMWSMGVTFWEILMEGKSPYEQKLHYSEPSLVAKMIKTGKLRVRLPVEFSTDYPFIFGLVESLFTLEASKRPSAEEISKRIQVELEALEVESKGSPGD